jgi:hypothetical protein
VVNELGGWSECSARVAFDDALDPDGFFDALVLTLYRDVAWGLRRDV